MKKLKVILIAIILIILTISIAGNASASEAPDEVSSSFLKGYGSRIFPTDGSASRIRIVGNTMAANSNMYCVEKGQDLPDDDATKYPHYLSDIVRINGNTAQFYKVKGYYKGTIIEGKYCEGDYNNIIAAILCAKNKVNGDKLSRGWGSSQTSYSDSQVALYYYWNEWVNNVKSDLGEKDFTTNFSTYSDNPNIANESKYNAKGLLNEYKKLADINWYNVTIFLMKPNSSGYQNVIIITRGDPEAKGLTVTKKWLDNENAYNTRLSEIKVQLYTVKDRVETPVEGKILTLNATNNWKDTFFDLPKTDSDGNEIMYTVKEAETYNMPDYESTGIVLTSGNIGSTQSSYTITNKLKTKVTVKKEWNDNDDLDDLRPSAIRVELYSNGNATGVIKDLDESNNWTATFDGLYKCDEKGKVIEYSVVEWNKYDENGNEVTEKPDEDSVRDYTRTDEGKNVTEDEKGNVTITITNTHTPEYAGYIEITGKVWEDIPDGKANKINGVIDEDELGMGGIKVTLKDKSGNQFDATSTTTTAEDGTYMIKVNYDDSNDVYKLYEDDSIVKKANGKQITEYKLKTAYIEFEYDGYVYTTVAKGGYGDVNKSKATEVWASKNVPDKSTKTRQALDEKYSTITSTSPTETEIPEEDKKVIATTKDVITNFISYRDKTVKKVKVNLEERTETQTVKYCNGDGTYIHTNPNGAWNEIVQGNHICENCPGTGHSMRTYEQIEVKTIKNVNLGLYKREMPDLSVKEEPYEVRIEETVNKKTTKSTYKYNTVVVDETEAETQVQFANKQTATYRRPVNPTSIETLKEAYNSGLAETMSVYVTYAVTITNDSDTLKATVNSLINCFDNRYTLESAKIGTTKIKAANIQKYENQTKEGIYKQSEKDYTEIKLNNLNISINAGKTSSIIYLEYKVSPEAIIDLLEKDATLSNSVEIESYTTKYASKTRYAQYSKDGRNGKVYAGYDKDSHPGNAGIKLETVDYTYTYTEGEEKIVQEYKDVEVLKSTENLIEYKLTDGTIINMHEDDTDIAPSFVLCKDFITIKGIVFEDADEITNDEGMLGNGKYNEDENKVKNVRVELHKVIKDAKGNITGSELVQSYNKNAPSWDEAWEDAIQYTGADGKYSFKVRLESNDYVVKYVYGNDETILINGVTTIGEGVALVDARKYKSTTITDTVLSKIINKDYKKFTDANKIWYSKIDINSSIAVDDADERATISLDSSVPETITASSKPFLITAAFIKGDTKITELKDEKVITLKFGIIGEKTPTETVSVTVNKIWDDENNQAGRRPDSITVYLKDGETVKGSIELNESNGWKYTFTGLPKYGNNGKEIVYEVQEEPVSGYKTEIMGNMSEGYTITNKFMPTTISGFVFEDTDDDRTDDQRLGNGKYDEANENKVENVKVELYEIAKNAETGTLENKLVQTTHTNKYGNYNFGIAEEATEEDKVYFIKYTYGDDTEKLGNLGTTMDGGNTVVNARNYKSTIIKDDTIYKILQLDYEDEEFDKLWYTKHNDGYSVAVDDMQERLNIGNLQYNNFHEEGESTYVQAVNMSAYTKPFLIPKGTAGDINKFNFGIIERPRENLSVEKTITDFKITLANGQILTQGNPSENSDINYVKVIGFNQTNQAKKELVAEMDAELIQGASLEIKYKISVTNGNEKDYDYSGDYGDEFDDTSKLKYVTNEKAQYYYFGRSTGLSEIQATIEYVDYLDGDIICNDKAQLEEEQIQMPTANDLFVEGLMSEALSKKLGDKNYQIFKKSETIARGETKEVLTMSVSKVLGSNSDNEYGNYVEIIQIDGKTARTIERVGEAEEEDGKQIEKSYKPGNLEPGVSENEQDDDGNETTITPPTGIITYILYVLVGLAGLIVIAGGITFIKKKVLIK